MAISKLNKDWLTEGHIDLEYKQYVLLAYFKEVNKAFSDIKLYPFLADIIEHYKHLISFQDGKKELNDGMPKRLKKIDWESFMIEYEKMIEDKDYIKEIESIIEFALPKFEGHMNNGREIYDEIEDGIEIYPVGLVSLNNEEGFFMLRSGMQDTLVYEYKLSLFEGAQDKYRGLKTKLINTYRSTITRTYEQIRKDLLYQFKEYVNPATFAIETSSDYPLEETMIPIAKRSFIRYLVKNE
ncbi:MAG TPA: hypothetical protein EYQ86_05200 [Bacteroidetes bacterium]|nr:hypothetical protein [Bacteroidota bacterium]